MIREEEIREFHEIIGRGVYDSESEQNDDENEEEYTIDEDFLDAREEHIEGEEVPVKPIEGNSVIFYITTIFGLIFLIAVIIGVLVFLHLIRGDTKKHSNKKNGTNTGKNSDKWRPPGYKELVTDPRPGDNVRVWAIRTAIPPKPYLYLYFSLMRPSEFKGDEDTMLEL